MPSRSDFDAIVSHANADALSKSSPETPRYRTIEAAIEAAPQNGARPWRIGLAPGRYREKLEINKPHIHLIGTDRERCILSFDAFAGQRRPNSERHWTTFGCATLIVRAPDFSATQLTIGNDFDYLANDARTPDDPTYTADPQAVALMLADGSDRASFHRVNISGYQDTLFVDSGRSHFEECTIAGNVDFIFGAGRAFFERCLLVCRSRRKPGVFPWGYVTAPSTQLTDFYGLVFHRCDVVAEDGTVPANAYALGRPWHPAKQFSEGRYADPDAVGSSVFIDCFLGSHIHADGWWSMTGLQKSGPTRTVFYPEESRFFEFANRGPGAAHPASAKRRQLQIDEASRYARDIVLSPWNPTATRARA